MAGSALQVFAGPRALRLLHRKGLRAADVRVIPAAAGGPKGLVLHPLDRYLFVHWLRDTQQVVHVVGASIGAWRMASACDSDPARALGEFAEDYITQRYEHPPGKPPEPARVSAVFAAMLQRRLGGRTAAVLSHPTRRLHVVASRGRHVLARQGRVRTPLGYLGAAATNLLHRRALGLWLEQVVFSDPRDDLSVPLSDFRTRHAPLTADNLVPAVLASCSIPFWLDAVHDIPQAPAGAYWDGGITDYHLHWNYAALSDGLVLYPHFQATVVPGWLDKALKGRHRASAMLDNVVVLAPSKAWIATLPRGKLPDRSDFKAYADDTKSRIAAWRRALAESQRLADEFSIWAEGGAPPMVRALA